MKKILFILFISLLIPINVLAKSYTAKDMTIDIDDSNWYVFTRDNIYNNPELDELGITYDYLNNFMNTSDVYLDACLFDTNDNNNTIELFVLAKKSR